MFCPHCGQENPAHAAHCAACGTSLAPGTPAPPPGPVYGGPPPFGQPGGHGEPRPDNHLVWAILATLFCCLPTGIAAIVFAAQVDSRYQARDYAGARESAGKARFWSLVSLAGPLVAVLAYGLLILFAVGVGSLN